VLLNNSYEILGKFQAFIKPIKNPILSEFCKKLTSIQQKDIDNALKFPFAFRKFIKWVEETAKCKIQDITFCSWGYYDKKQLTKDCKLHNIKYPFLVHRSIKHEFAKKENIKPPGLKKALGICGFKLEGTHHRALDDAKNIAKIFIKERIV
jgi:inhibitor of KinA sporulation pathway (predicted exonuclease)